jgi:hypothetical protein
MQQVSGHQDFQPWLYCSSEDPCPDPIEEKLQSFATLQEGWNYGEGRAPSQLVIDGAIEIYRIGKKLALDAEVFPIVNGDIEISLYAGDHFMDILVHEGGRLDFSHEEGVGEKYNTISYVENISIDAIKQRLSELPKLCGASESLETTIIEVNVGLPITVSPTTTMLFQLLIGNASQYFTAPRFVNT